MDKTNFIRNELQNMLQKNEIPAHLRKEVQGAINYLTYNNIFAFERYNSREQYGDELIDILVIARNRYWEWKNNNEQ